MVLHTRTVEVLWSFHIKSALSGWIKKTRTASISGAFTLQIVRTLFITRLGDGKTNYTGLSLDTYKSASKNVPALLEILTYVSYLRSFIRDRVRLWELV